MAVRLNETWLSQVSTAKWDGNKSVNAVCRSVTRTDRREGSEDTGGSENLEWLEVGITKWLW